MNIEFVEKPTNKYFHDLNGLIVGRLTVLGYAGRKGPNHYWFCKCSCETIKIINWQSLMRGNSTSCGCRQLEILIARSISHGESRGGKPSVEFQAYRNAKDRCSNSNRKDWKNYGGRGIKFCFSKFADFLAELGRKPTSKHTLDRIDNEGHYEVGNVRWATRFTQAHNRRTPKIRVKSPTSLVDSLADCKI